MFGEKVTFVPEDFETQSFIC